MGRDSSALPFRCQLPLPGACTGKRSWVATTSADDLETVSPSPSRERASERPCPLCSLTVPSAWATLWGPVHLLPESTSLSLPGSNLPSTPSSKYPLLCCPPWKEHLGAQTSCKDILAPVPRPRAHHGAANGQGAPPPSGQQTH